MSTAMQPFTDRVPPQNTEAEKSVLGGILRDNAVMSDVLGILRTENFYQDAHQKIFAAMTDIYNSAKPIDAVILFTELKKRKQIEDIGGAVYLAELYDSCPTAANAIYYAGMIRNSSVVRGLITSATETLRHCYDGGTDADELLAAAERDILGIADRGSVSNVTTLSESLFEAVERIDARTKHKVVDGIHTGYFDLDTLTGGFQNSELTIVAARPSIGKTAFALNIARNIIASGGNPILFVSLEQSKIELAERLLVCQARVDSHHVRTGRVDAEGLQRLSESNDFLTTTKMFIDDTPCQNLLRITSTARRLKLREGLKMVIIDYLQLIEPENRRDPRQEQVAQMSRRLKHLARELKIPVVALAQVNRGPEDRKDTTPRLSDLRESGAIEQDADCVVMLHRPPKSDNGDPENILEVHIAKQRNGPTGQITLAYLKQYMRFENYCADDRGMVPS